MKTGSQQCNICPSCYRVIAVSLFTSFFEMKDICCVSQPQKKNTLQSSARCRFLSQENQNMSYICKSGIKHRLSSFRCLLFFLHSSECTWRGKGWEGFEVREKKLLKDDSSAAKFSGWLNGHTTLLFDMLNKPCCIINIRTQRILTTWSTCIF